MARLCCGEYPIRYPNVNLGRSAEGAEHLQWSRSRVIYVPWISLGLVNLVNWQLAILLASTRRELVSELIYAFFSLTPPFRLPYFTRI
jgi:hypothetical protein